MQYQVVVTNYRIDGIKYRRGDVLEMSEERAAVHGVKLQRYFEPVIEPSVEPIIEVKPKRKRRTKAEMEAARKANNEEE